MNTPAINLQEVIDLQQKVIDDLIADSHSREAKLLAVQEGIREAAKFIRNGQFETGIQLIEALLERMK